MELTKMEAQVMEVIPQENFYEDGFDSLLWVDCFLDTLKSLTGIEPRRARGLLTSLQAKCLIGVQAADGKGRQSAVLWLDGPGKRYLVDNHITGIDGRFIEPHLRPNFQPESEEKPARQTRSKPKLPQAEPAEPEVIITTRDLASQLGITPAQLRKKLRGKIETNQHRRYAFKAHEIEAIKELLK